MFKKKKLLPYLPDSIQNIIIKYCHHPPKYIDELKDKTSRLFYFLNSWYPTSGYDRVVFNTKSNSVIDFSYKSFAIINIKKRWYLGDITNIKFILENQDLEKFATIQFLGKRHSKRAEIYGISNYNTRTNKCHMYY